MHSGVIGMVIGCNGGVVEVYFYSFEGAPPMSRMGHRATLCHGVLGAPNIVDL